MAGALGTATGLARIAAAMRDPRFDVRSGALVGMWRHCASAAVNGNADTEATVVALLREGRALPATRTEVARICADVGYASALGPARELEALVDRGARKVLDEATARLASPPSAVGAWVDLGHDLGENDPAATVAGHAVMMGTGDGVVVLGKAKPMRGPLRRPGACSGPRLPGPRCPGR